jgi:hypothetical protein
MTRQSLRTILTAVPLVLAALVMSSSAAQQKPATTTKPAGATSQAATAPPTKANLKDVVRHIDNYLGKTIEVEGEVLSTIPPNMMVIDSRRWFHVFGGVLVIMPAPVAGVIIRADDQVRVVGKVEKLVLAEAKKRWSFLSDPGIQIDLFEKPIIVATSAVVIPKT